MASEADDPALLATVGSGDPAKREPLAKKQLGRYQLEGLLGAGGMGEVHRAIDLDLERHVAIKVLHASSTGSARLLREARAMARLDHPNVVKIFEVDTVDGTDFVVMELVAGESLAHWLQVPRPRAEVIRAFIAAGSGLASAHEAGMVHRDFKPANVLRSHAGAIKVGDFGLARSTSDPSPPPVLDPAARPSFTPSLLAGLTATGTMVGTPAYMAPEQWSSGAISAATDQFAFCVALWEALVGERPFRGDSIDELRKAIDAGAPDPAKLSKPYRAILLRGLAKDPAARWPSMHALLDELAPRPIKPAWIAGAVLALAAIIAGTVLVVRGGDEHRTELDAPHVFVPKQKAELVKTIVPLARAVFMMPRTTVSQILLERTELTESLRAVPTKDVGDNVIGFRLFAIRPHSAAEKLGLEDADQVSALDEIPLDSDDHIRQAYLRAQSSNQLTLHFTRRGAAKTIAIYVFP